MQQQEWFVQRQQKHFMHSIKYLILNVLFHSPRMGEGNVFILSVCVCLYVYLCVSVSVRAINFECLDIEASSLIWWNILIISIGQV